MTPYSTFILFWNPQISNFKDEQRGEFVQALRDGFPLDFNWAVHDWRSMRIGDRFFRIRCGMPNPADDGLIDSGYFTSKPFLEEDWSGKKRKVYYAEMEFDMMLDFNYCPVLSSEKLDLRIPHFDWHGGHSGRLIDSRSGIILEDLWYEHLKSLREDPLLAEHLYIE